jgi:hypothetical protein
METEKRTKWDIGVAIDKGNQSVALVEKYQTDIVSRLQPDELAQHKANIKEVEARRAGQKETLVAQKSKTLGQDEAISILYTTIASIRNIVKSSSPNAEILKAYGVGEKTSKTVTSVTASGNMVITAYNSFTAWSNLAGIIEADIVEIQALTAQLSTVDVAQESSKFTRKSKTMDKNQLQRAVEDEVTKLSALGVHVFHAKDPAISALFAGLSPSSAKPETQPSANPVEAKV